MTNAINEQAKKSETKRITGKSYDAVIRQLVETYHSGNGWAVSRVVNKIISVDVYVERSTAQGDPSQATVAQTTKTVSEAPEKPPVVDIEVTKPATKVAKKVVK